MTETQRRLRDMAERLLWTFVSSVPATGVMLDALTDWTTLRTYLTAALTSTVTTALNWLTLIARHRLRVLPDPGQMFAPPPPPAPPPATPRTPPRPPL